MPGVIAFKRRWRIGSDDFVFPALVELFVKFMWFTVVLEVSIRHRDHLQCSDGRLLRTYLLFYLGLLSFVILLDAMIAWISSRGTITQIRPRRHLPQMLYLRVAVMVVEIIWTIIGTKWAFTAGDHPCEPQQVISLVQIIVISSWIILVLIIFGIIMVFDPIGTFMSGYGHRVADVDQCEPQPLYINLNAAGIEKARKSWEWQVKLFCCCCGNRDETSKDAYPEIAKLFSSYFDDLDLVPSDVIAGLILLQQKQAAENANRVSTSQHSENYSVQSPDSLTSTGAVQGSIISSPGVFTPPSNQFWMTPEMAYHFMKFAVGSYGWPMFIYSNFFTGICKMWRQIKCCACCCETPNYIVDDNCCQCHTAALKYVTGLKDEDLIYVSFHNRVYEIPFYVAVDHQSCSVVVAVRGTLSLSDTLTDLTADCDRLFTETCPQGMFCHRGMLRAACFVKNRLDESHALSDAFALHQSYSLTILGHSLGAGTATILAVMLRPLYPNIRCFAFSPPGGLVSLEGVKYTEDFVMSVTLGDDLVPRLSVPNIEDMKRKLLNCILDCEKPKYKIFLHKFLSCFGKGAPLQPEGTAPVSRPLLESFGQTSSVGHYTTNNSSQEGSSEGSVSSSQTAAHSRQIAYVPLYLPGRILHLSRFDSSIRGRWVTADYFNQIIISPRMLADHMPDKVHNALKQLNAGNGNFIP